MNTCGSIYRNMHFFTQMPYRFYMVRVVMCNKYATYAFHRDVMFFQRFFYSSDTYSGINQYSVILSAQIVAVTATATCQAYKFYFHTFSVKIQNAVSFYDKVTAKIGRA